MFKSNFPQHCWWQSTSLPEVWDPLVSDASWYQHREAQNLLLPLSGMLDPCQPSSTNWKLISFDTTWLHTKFPTKTLASLYLFGKCLKLGIMSTSSVCLPLQIICLPLSLYIFPNCKSLWIKVSAKWLKLNVNVNKMYLLKIFFYCIWYEINILQNRF